MFKFKLSKMWPASSGRCGIDNMATQDCMVMHNDNIQLILEITYNLLVHFKS